MDIARAEKGNLKSPVQTCLSSPNLLSDLASSIFSMPYVTALDFLLYNEVVNLKNSDFHPVVSAVFQAKKEQTEWDHQPI